MSEVFPDLIMDACCLINLYAAERILAPTRPPKFPHIRRKITGKGIRPETAKADKPRPPLAFNLHVPAKVIEETLYIRKPDKDDKKKLIEVLIDLKPIFNQGFLHSCDLRDQAEIELFVRLATGLDDGEAVGMAIAKMRRWALASDDRKARRIATQLGVNLLTTPELVKAWAEMASASDADVAQVLQNIQTYARFVPHKTMPLFQWWMDAIGWAQK